MAGVTVCPAAVVAATCEQVWTLLAQPELYAVWIDARVLRIEPPGPAAPGQVVSCVTRALGREWKLSIEVEEVDEARRQIAYVTRLPFGIVGHNHITCAPLGDGRSCRVQFG